MRKDTARLRRSHSKPPPASEAPALRSPVRAALTRTLKSFAQMLPILLATLLLSSLILAWLPRTGLLSLFGRGAALDVLLGASLGSVAMGHPVAGYVLGGELLTGGVSLIAVTALIVAWVTVGVAHVAAEAMMLGKRFALWRNLLCYFSAIAIAYLAILVMRLMG
jgi:uncharacterized membrane protein YraQ (UPF0718 family)